MAGIIRPTKRRREWEEVLHQHWLVLYRRRYVVLWIAAATVLSVVVVLFVRHSAFRATAYLRIESTESQADNSITDADSICPEVFAQVCRSDLAWDVIEKLRLAVNPNRWALSKEPAGFSTDKTVIDRHTRIALTAVFLSQLNIRPHQDLDDVLCVEFSSADSVVSASVANAVAASLSNFSEADLEISPTNRTHLTDIDTRINQVQTRIDGEPASADIVRQISDVVRQQAAMIDPLRVLELEKMQAELSYNSLFPPDGSPNRDLLESDLLNQLRQQRADIEQEWASLTKRYGRRHPEFQAVQRQRDLLDTEIRNEENRIIEYTTAQYRKTRREFDDLVKQHDELTAQFDRLEKKRLLLESLEKELVQLRSERDDLSTRIDRDSSESDSLPFVAPAKFSIHSWASVPPGLFSKSLSSPLLIALLTGLVGGVGFAFFMEYYDRSIRSPVEAAQATGLLPIAAIPLLKARRNALPGRIAQDLPGSKASMAFKTLGEWLERFIRKNRIRSLAISSTHPREGKTTVLTNLAIVLAQAGYRVLVVDGNLRTPSVHTVFGSDGLLGLSNVLSETRDLSEAIRPVNILGVSILPAGRVTADPLDFIGSAKMREIFLKLREEADLTLVDTPASLTATDAALLASMVDGTLLVVRSGVPTPHEIRMALRRITSSSGKMIGLILNGVDVRESTALGTDLANSRNLDSLDVLLTEPIERPALPN
ncbi:MAG: polysaccharide biosynthesis tyrosine autokinase [bacterium]